MLGYLHVLEWFQFWGGRRGVELKETFSDSYIFYAVLQVFQPTRAFHRNSSLDYHQINLESFAIIPFKMLHAAPFIFLRTIIFLPWHRKWPILGLFYFTKTNMKSNNIFHLKPNYSFFRDLPPSEYYHHHQHRIEDMNLCLCAKVFICFSH